MIFKKLLAAWACLVLVGVAPVAQESPSAVEAPATRAPASLEAWALPGVALPEGVTRTDGFHAISIQARSFLNDPTVSGVLPGPVGSLTQLWVTAREGARPLRGGFAVLEYAHEVPEDVSDLLGGLLWGADGSPTPRHPENVAVSDRFLVLLSFDGADPTGDWLRDALHTAAGLRLPHTWAGIADELDEVFAAVAADDSPAGMAAIDAHAELFAGHALVNYLAGEFASADQHWARAAEGYARAVALHDDGADLLPGAPGTLWAALDGLGLALIAQDEHAQGIPVLQRAVDLARELGQAGPAAQSGYNLACALARRERFEESLAVLRACIESDASYAEMARGDGDFRRARERRDFQELLAP